MEKKQVEVSCPTCASRLLVDVRSEKILRTRRPEELDATGKPKVDAGDWDDALNRVQDRESRRELAAATQRRTAAAVRRACR